MVTQAKKQKGVRVTIPLPQPLYAWLEECAEKKGQTAAALIEDWIIKECEPWECHDQLPLDVAPHSVVEYEDPRDLSNPYEASRKPEPAGTRREDFPDAEAYLKAEQADRQARAQATRKKNREAQPKVLAEHIRRIAEARVQHPTLSLRQFSPLLFDRRIYRSQPLYGDAKPVNSATLSVWLKEAREAGMLPKAAMPTRTPRVKKVSYPRKPKP